MRKERVTVFSLINIYNVYYSRMGLCMQWSFLTDLGVILLM